MSPSELFNKINIGDHVTGHKDGVRYSGIVTDMEDERLPRGQGAKSYKFTIKLDEPINLYGVERKTIRIRLEANGSTRDEDIRKNPGVSKRSEPPFMKCTGVRIKNGKLEIRK